MLKLKKIAITGSLGAGKTTVCTLFEQLGATYVSTDKIVHKLLSSTTKTSQKVIALLGNEIIIDGQINRDEIAKRVFDDRALLEQLEHIIHPEVLKELERKYLEANSLFIAEVPLLFEAGFETFFDTTIAVISDKKRESTTTMTKKRKARMLSKEELINRSDLVLENNSTKEELKTHVQTLYNQLIQS